MREIFHLKSKSFSINAMYGHKKFKTSAARDWEYGVLHELNSTENLQKFERLRSHFDPNKHSFSVSIIVSYPEQKFYAQSTQLISSHTHDVSNVEKPLIDLFFLPKYYDLSDPYGVKNLNCDDKFITRLFSMKKVGASNGITVKIAIIGR
jgi:hypothetical protein